MTRTVRRPHDFYPTTAEWPIPTLLANWDIPRDCVTFECCDGQGNLSNELEKQGFIDILRGDITNTSSYFDATSEDQWHNVQPVFTITNPPFNLAHRIVPLAYEYSQAGIAILLRLSYLEPCINRAEWLAEHPISKLIIMPRISFTGDGDTDKVTTAWFVWDKRSDKQEIIVVPKSEIQMGRNAIASRQI